MANRTKLVPKDKKSLTNLNFSGEHSSNLQTGVWKQTDVDQEGELNELAGVIFTGSAL